MLLFANIKLNLAVVAQDELVQLCTSMWGCSETSSCDTAVHAMCWLLRQPAMVPKAVSHCHARGCMWLLLPLPPLPVQLVHGMTPETGLADRLLAHHAWHLADQLLPCCTAAGCLRERTQKRRA
jgi:hypothetical protein